MSKLDLPDVTLCCVDTRSVPQALQALQRCMAAARFGEVLFFGPPEVQSASAQRPFRTISIPALTGIEAYNRFMLRGLLPHIQTSHVLIVQWDGFIINPERWQPEFLKWDYVGAPWYQRGQAGVVGNGGFSLRSRRLLQALAQIEVNTVRPEDEEICKHRRHQLEKEYAVRIAPLELAQNFSCEYGRYRSAFGFHGMHNFSHVLNQDELAQWLETAPPELLVTKHARNLVKSLIRRHRGREAFKLLRRRARITGWTIDHWALCIRILVQGFRSRRD